MSADEKQAYDWPGSTGDDLGVTQLDRPDSVDSLQQPPALTRDMLHARLMESGATPRQIERFLDPRNGRLRPPYDVTNRYVFDLLRGVYSMIQNEPKIDEIERWVKGQGPAAIRLRDEVREELRNSGLAQALPGGFDLLPDFYAALPQWVQPWYRLVRPRNFYQLGRHIAGNLQWYLDPSKKINFVLSPLLAFLPAVAPLAMPLVYKYLPAKLDVLLLIGIGVMLVTQLLFRKRRAPAGLGRSDIERVELYLYLCEEYSQAVDHTPV